MTMPLVELAKTIDHALLKPELTDKEIILGCATAAKFNVASVCVRPADIPLAVKELSGSVVEVGTVIGFPHGALTADTKLFESRQALDLGATELDVVVNIGKVKEGDWDFVRWELGPIISLCKEQNALSKIIFENCYLTDQQKIELCNICVDLGADYVKTSTGFGTGGATLKDIALMKKAVDGKAKVKAAGGISDLETAIAFVKAGCQRIGCSATATVLAGMF